MPGFIDVSNMTDEEIRRLGHEDDEDTNHRPVCPVFYGAKRKTSLVKKPSFSYESDKVWGAAVVAFRVNNGLKALAPGIPTHKTNRQIVEELLQDNVPLQLIDLEEGRKIRQYFKGLTFKVIEGKTLSPFLTIAMQIASKDFISDNLGIGTITSLPATYQKMTQRDTVDNRIKWANGGFVGVEGDKTTQTIEIVKSMWSSNYNTFYYTGINGENQVLFFANRAVLEIGSSVTIEGKIKSHRDNSTQLSHVKVIK